MKNIDNSCVIEWNAERSKGSFLRDLFHGNLAPSELRRVEQEIDIPTPDRLQSRLPDRKRQVNSNNICHVFTNHVMQ